MKKSAFVLTIACLIGSLISAYAGYSLASARIDREVDRQIQEKVSKSFDAEYSQNNQESRVVISKNSAIQLDGDMAEINLKKRFIPSSVILVNSKLDLEKVGHATQVLYHRLEKIPGVTGIHISDYKVRIWKAEAFKWSEITPKFAQIVNDFASN